MTFKELKELAVILMTVEADRKIKSLSKFPGDENKLNGIFINYQNKETAMIVEYFPKNDSIRIYQKQSDYNIGVQKVSVLKEYKKKNTTNKDFEKPILTRTQLAKKIQSGKITFELHGHFTGTSSTNEHMVKRLKETFLDEFERNVDGAAGENDGKWTLDEKTGETMNGANKRMREHYSIKLKREYRINDHLFESYDIGNCSVCGKHLDIVLTDKNTISVYPGFRMKDVGDFNVVCDFQSGPPHTGGKIKIESDMVVTNFLPHIKGDVPKDKEYSDEYSLCSYNGRRNITKWKAENKNVAYGQMSNMSLSIWINKAKDHIILTEAYMESDVKEKKLKKMGMKKVGGRISLAMWRWEATDVKTLEKAAGKKIGAIKAEMKKDYRDIETFPVKHGEWIFNHYFDTTPDPEDEDELFIYAELKLNK
jgi:hypothetical protein